MSTPVLATKLYIPPLRPKVILRPRLIQKLNEGLGRTPGVTLISAPAGFGKTTVLSAWVDDLRLRRKKGSNTTQRVAWLSLDEADNDPARVVLYLVMALRTIDESFGAGALAALQAPQPQTPPIQGILTDLVNELASVPDPFVLVLDDYHVIDSEPVDQAISFLIDHLPPHMHLVISTREDPDLPLARERAQDRLTELRASDLRFTLAEAADFLNQVMGLKLSEEDVAALESRTEGWIAGLQLAALSMRGHEDASSFVKSFSGSHRFVMDYLMEEVLGQQPGSLKKFLLYTSILDRLCGSLCDAVLQDPSSPTSGQETLERLERANLFIVPLDDERRWYRYHHLFADLLRQKLQQHLFISTGEGHGQSRLDELHNRASRWYEDADLQLEAFQHAAAAHDIERAERLIDGSKIPLHFSGGVTPILNWLESLPVEVMKANPRLWWRHAAMLLINGQTAGVAEKLQAAEDAVANIQQGAQANEETRRLIGRIAAARATLALTRYDVETMLIQSRRALEHLEPSNAILRSNAYWTLGFAHTILSDRHAARQAFMESISLSQTAGAMFQLMLATIGLAYMQELDNELHQAAETYRRVLKWVGDRQQQIINEVHLGLARILYEWNDLDAAERHAQQSLHLARQYESVIDRFVIGEVFLARLRLAQGNVDEAAAILAGTAETVRRYNFVHRMPEVAAVQVLAFVRQGNLAAAAELASSNKLPLSQARVYLAQGTPFAALETLNSFRQEVDAKGWKDEQLRAIVLQAVAHQAEGKTDEALQTLEEALASAEPGGFIRIFVDQGEPMAQLLSRAADRKVRPPYVEKLLAAFQAEQQNQKEAAFPSAGSLIEPLSPRELEVLQLIAQGLSNEDIGNELYLALDTVKGHNRRIFDKLQVQRRTEAVARARELGLL